jgi:hypothetical protein
MLLAKTARREEETDSIEALFLKDEWSSKRQGLLRT